MRIGTIRQVAPLALAGVLVIHVLACSARTWSTAAVSTGVATPAGAPQADEGVEAVSLPVLSPAP